MKPIKTICCLAVLSAALLSANAQTAAIDSINYVGYGPMTISGSPDETWDIQQSSDGSTWTTVGSATLSDGTASVNGEWDPSQFYQLYNDGLTSDQTCENEMYITVTNLNSFDITVSFYENDSLYGDGLTVSANNSAGFLVSAQWGTACTLEANDANYIVDLEFNWVGFLDLVDITVSEPNDDPGFVESGEILCTGD